MLWNAIEGGGGAIPIPVLKLDASSGGIMFGGGVIAILPLWKLDAGGGGIILPGGGGGKPLGPVGSDVPIGAG